MAAKIELSHLEEVSEKKVESEVIEKLEIYAAKELGIEDTKAFLDDFLSSFMLEPNLECLRLFSRIRNECCSLPVELSGHSYIEFGCPGEEVRKIPCLEEPFDREGEYVEEREVAMSPMCEEYHQEYSNECLAPLGEGESEQVDLCPEVVEYQGQALPLCSQLRAYLEGEPQESSSRIPGQEPAEVIAQACNPLGVPTEEDLPRMDLIPEVSGDEDPITTDEDSDRGIPSEGIDVIETDGDFKDQTKDILRLEVPGSFVRYHATQRVIGLG